MNDEYAISVAKTEFREAWNAGDVQRLLNVFSPEFTDWTAAQPSFYGAEGPVALRWRMQRLFEEYETRLDVVVIAVVVRDDTAWDYGWHNIHLRRRAGGRETKSRERYFELWRRQPDGSWKIALFMSNADVASTMLPEEATSAEARKPAAASAVD
jgi:uncharacterized protein (TIGR02246 family)